MNGELLQTVALKLQKKPLFLHKTKYPNHSFDAIIGQIIAVSYEHQQKYVDPFSWFHHQLTLDKNNVALNTLIEQGDIIQQDYEGELTPPNNTFYINDKPQILRVTDQLLGYINRLK